MTRRSTEGAGVVHHLPQALQIPPERRLLRRAFQVQKIKQRLVIAHLLGRESAPRAAQQPRDPRLDDVHPRVTAQPLRQALGQPRPKPEMLRQPMLQNHPAIYDFLGLLGCLESRDERLGGKESPHSGAGEREPARPSISSVRASAEQQAATVMVDTTLPGPENARKSGGKPRGRICFCPE